MLAVCVLIPCVTPTTPTVYFDVDPRLSVGLDSGGEVVTAIGPTGMATLQGGTVLLAVLGIAAAVWAGGPGTRLLWWAIVLAGLGVLAAVGHMFDGNARWEDWTRGGAWVTAAAVGVAGYHVAQHPAARRWIAALLCAATIPLAAEAAWDVWVQHADDVAYFEAHRGELLNMRGFEASSEQAALYERRLRTAEASGVFTTSNLLASVAGALGLCGAALFVTRRFRGGGGWAGLVCAVAGALTVWLTTSRGAAVAVVMAAALLVWLVLTQCRRAPRWITPALALGLVALAFSAVLVRGGMGPPEAPADGFVAGRAIEGERSLLFRAQYWSASAQMMAGHPLRGVGARGFADGYPAAKDPLNPETVTSAHNVFVDQIAMLGMGGVAWSALLLGWLGLAAWRVAGVLAGQSAGEVNDAKPLPVGRGDVWLAVSAAVVVFGVSLSVRQATLYLDTAVLWLVAAAGFVAVAAVLGSRDAASDRVRQIGLLLAAAVVLVHNQIEMTFFQPESMGLMWLIVGSAAAGSAGAGKARAAPAKPRWVTPIIGAVLAASLLAGMGIYLAGVVRHESAMEGAAAALRRGDNAVAVERLERAQHAAGWDTEALRWRVRLHAVEPLGPLVQSGREGLARQRVDEAIAWINEATKTRGTPATIARLRGQLLDRRAMTTGDRPDDLAAAQAAYEQLRPLSPYNVQDAWLRADLAKRRGDRESARELFREVLALREMKYLDPADPLTASQLQSTREYLADADPDAKAR